MTTTTPKLYRIEDLSEDEWRACVDALNAANLWFGPPPDPPTAVMRALVKVERAGGR
jgi:hypothetical protein